MMRLPAPSLSASSATRRELVTIDIVSISQSARTTHTPDVESSSMIELPEGTIAAAHDASSCLAS